MADTLTSLLNSEIQRDTTTLDADLEQYLLSLEEGVYTVGGGTLTVEAGEDELDTITGTVRNNQSTLTSTDWYSGDGPATQELIDLVSGLQLSGVYFVYDLDTSFTGATFADLLYWNGSAVTTATINATTFTGTFATGFTEGQLTYTWDTSKGFLEGLDLAGTDITLQIV